MLKLNLPDIIDICNQTNEIENIFIEFKEQIEIKYKGLIKVLLISYMSDKNLYYEIYLSFINLNGFNYKLMSFININGDKNYPLNVYLNQNGKIGQIDNSDELERIIEKISAKKDTHEIILKLCKTLIK